MSKEIQLHGGTITSFVDYNELLENFTCGNADMDVFLKEKAVGLTNSSETGTSGFFNDEDELVGFYSLSAAKIEIQNGYDSKTFANLSESAAYLASNVSYPAIKLDFFAVNEKHQRKHYGSAMLKRIFVGLYLTQMIANVGFVALILDATPEAVEFYEQLGFEYLHRDLEKDSRILDTYPMFIRMDTIKAIAEFIGVPDDPYNY